MYRLSDKAIALTPYDPSEGVYRVRMDANESFLLPTDLDRKKMAQAAADIALNRYPDPLAREVCASFAQAYGIRSELVTAGNGSDELISLILSVFLQKGEKVLTLSPDFSMYRFYTTIAETPCMTLEKDEDLRISVDQVLDTLAKENIRLLIFSNPCNPTSVGLDRGDVRRLLNGTDALVVLDEAYMDFWDQSLLNEVEKYDNLIILRTCSKMLGMAALRLGFAVANPRLTGILKAAKSPYNVNAVTQAMANVVLANPIYKNVYREILIESRNELLTSLRKLEAEGLIDRIYDSCTNFVYIRLKGAKRIYDLLRDRGILVRRFGDDYLRITAATQAENEEVTAVIRFLQMHKEVK